MKKAILKFVYLLVKKAETIGRIEEINSLIKNGILNVGKGTYQIHLLNIDQYKGSEAKIFIGKYCSISKGVKFITGGIHPKDWISTYPFRIRLKLNGAYQDGLPSTKGDIIIGNDVWIGTGVTVLSGVKIGNGVIISANSVVTHDIPDYAIIAGIPAKIIKFRFSAENISFLNDLKWWDWEEERIIDNVKLLSSSNIESFRKQFHRS